MAFRWVQGAEFVQAIREERQAVPSFHEGVHVQAAMQAIHESADRGLPVPVPDVRAR
jgi:hypothetical protein